ncbi:STAS domain-containing protein [Frigidibacter sp. MR17.24]|uniref:STAS domain-containing protein n=1 Tax=Frigidibacter sp. MR17.24 TaxID=3127345 RepID=UPI003FA60615
MNLQSLRQGPVLVVRVGEPRIDAAVAIQFKDRMRALIAEAPGIERVMLELGAVDFIDSSGLGAIVAVKRALDPAALDLAALTPPVERLFQLTRMVEFFRLHPGVSGAAQEASGGGGAQDTSGAGLDDSGAGQDAEAGPDPGPPAAAGGGAAQGGGAPG